MNSYFEQSGFYGQTAGGAEQAYRFPLGLAGMGVSPYSQHTQPRQDASAYDTSATSAALAAQGNAAIAAAAAASSPKSSGLYSPLNDSSSVYKSSSALGGNNPAANGGLPPDCNSTKDQNGYSSLSKELNSVSGWNSNGGTGGGGSTGGGSANNGSIGGGTTPVRPSVCTPEMTRYTPTTVDAVASARDRWMNTCTGLSGASALSSAAAQPQLQQTSPHQTFYPWMAIAGKSSYITIFLRLILYPITHQEIYFRFL